MFAHAKAVARIMSLGLVILLWIMASPVNAEEVSDSGNNSNIVLAPYVPGEVIVKYNDGTVAALAAEGTGPVALSALGAEITSDFSAEGLGGLQAIELSGPVSVKEAIEELERSPYVAYAEPNYIISLSLPETMPAGTDEVGELGVLSYPNDPKFSEQWGLSNSGQGAISGADIKIQGGWKVTTGSKDIVVAVIDTGVDHTHPDLAANIWRNPGETLNVVKMMMGMGMLMIFTGGILSTTTMTRWMIMGMEPMLQG